MTQPWLIKGQKVLKTMRAAACSRRRSKTSMECNQIGNGAALPGRTRPARPLHITALALGGREQLMLESLVKVLKRRFQREK